MKFAIMIVALMLVGCASGQKKGDADTKAAVDNQKSASTCAVDLKKISCTKGKEVRTLEVVKKGAGCALAYTKAEQTTDVATSNSGTKHCMKVKKKIKANLEKSGYHCE
jgi:hypothetical protein